MTRNPTLALAEDAADLIVSPWPETEEIRVAAMDACGLDAPSSPITLDLSFPTSLSAARDGVLAAARRMRDAYLHQHATRLTANDAENEWTIASLSGSASRDVVRQANRSRRDARQTHEDAWHAYQAAGQRLCRAAEWMVELEALDSDPPV